MESLEWLEEFLVSYRGSVVLVSHDSRFLDTLVNRVVELSQGKATEYRGNYSSYLLQKAQRRKIAESSYENRQKFIERTTRFVERFRYKNTRARQVQSRLKMLEKLAAIEIGGPERQIAFSFPDPPRSGRVVLELAGLEKSYGTKPVLRDISLTIESGDRIACLGVNGAGKSTLARVMAGIEACDRGERRVGHNVTIAYYGQNTTELLNPDRTVLGTLDEQAPFRSPGELRTLLGSFLFTGDDVFKPVSVLSGGEKSRLALAKMLLEPANFLILDEPTNHLDARSKAVLQKRLRDFPGTLYIVSHDRDFLAPITNKVLALRRGGVDVYRGTLEEYLERIHGLRESPENLERDTGTAGGGKEASADRERKRREALTRQERHRRIKPLRDEAAALEGTIEEAEARLRQIEAAFAREETFVDERLIQSLQKEYADLSAHLESLYDTWTARHESIEAVEREFSVP
ncbi:MAG: ABC-F family ATP-binding cassette domain-containing protein [Syntrophales bacterium]|nr:ABC-F family ATP-binding cassette domain-containing protein [Syntrophales bacterium]MCK9527046.1 ABC-F family ATP-binding cassette domain-containing protein [Syntrophales bacterium]